MIRVGILLTMVVWFAWSHATDAQSPPQTAEVTVAVEVLPSGADVEICFEVDRVGATPDPVIPCLQDDDEYTLGELVPDDYIIQVSNTSEVWGVVEIECLPRLSGTVTDPGDGRLDLPDLDAGDETTCTFTVKFAEVVPTATPTATATKTPTVTPTATVSPTAVPATSTPQTVQVLSSTRDVQCWNGMYFNVPVGFNCPAQTVVPATPVVPVPTLRISPPNTGGGGLLAYPCPNGWHDQWVEDPSSWDGGFWYLSCRVIYA